MTALKPGRDRALRLLHDSLRRCAWLLPLVAASGCRSSHLAELTHKSGTVERDEAASLNAWKNAEGGARFSLGDGIRTGKGAHADLALTNGSRMKVAPASLVRFMSGLPTETNLDVEFGDVTFDSQGTTARMRSTTGLAIIQPGTQLRIGKAGGKASYEVMVGLASLQVGEQSPVVLGPGKRMQVDIATAEIVVASNEPAPPPQEKAPAVPAEIAGPEMVVAQVSGRPARYQAPDEDAWRALPPGEHELSAGGALNVPAGGRVRLQRGKRNAVLHGAGSFKLSIDNTFLEADRGEVTFDHPDEAIEVVVPGGTIVVRADVPGGTRASMKVDGHARTKLQVREGAAKVTTESGSDQVRAGEALTLTPDGEMEVAGRGPEFADFTVTASESFVVHDPSPPTAVELDFRATCADPANARLRLGSRVVLPRREPGRIVIALPRGLHRYAVLCGDADTAVAEGSVQVLRDTGTLQLPVTPPATFVDTDGRKYTILYQNQLPEVRVRWPEAPPADGYVLKIATGDKSREVAVKRAQHVLPPANLPEGVHTLVFATTGDAPVESKSTTIKIRFDNAAPTAVVKAPKNGQFQAGATVLVAGTALPGWEVTAAGAPLPLDPQHRFKGDIRADPDKRAIAIRFEHRDRGVHYYVRRAGGRPQ